MGLSDWLMVNRHSRYDSLIIFRFSAGRTRVFNVIFCCLFIILVFFIVKMSFSKAKIQRFNDVKDCTPSPATYNVSLQEKIKLGLISKTGTYSKIGSPPRSESGSVHSTPCFQTPTLPLKKKKFLSFKSAKTSNQQEELREKIVECNNKDLYIRDLIEQIEEMTGKVNNLEQENLRLVEEKTGCEGALSELKQQYKGDNFKRAKEYDGISTDLKNINKMLRQVRQEHEELKCQNLVELSKLLGNIEKFQELYNKTVTHSREEVEALVKKLEDSQSKVALLKQELEQNNEKLREEHSKEVETLLAQHQEETQILLKKLEDSQAKIALLEEDSEQKNEKLREEHNKEVETLLGQHQEELQTLLKKLEDSQTKLALLEEELEQNNQKLCEEHTEETQALLKKLEESEAKVTLLEENFKDVKCLTELQMSDKIKEIEDNWKEKLEEKQKEHEAILKECQAISEYTIIQSEVEKNQVKNLLEAKGESYRELVKKFEILEEEVGILKCEKHKYELSISTFRDTIEVLKKRLFNSDRDVEQLKEELEKCEERVLMYEKKISEMTNQLNEIQTANEELEMQYESTSKLMQNQVQTIEKNLLSKVETFQNEARQVMKDKELLNDVLAQHHEQQKLLVKANSLIYDLGNRQAELEEEIRSSKLTLKEEMEEAAEIRKKYIEKSGKYDELAQQFEQLLQELDKAKERIQELEKLIGPYQEQLEAYQNELLLLTNEKDTIENEAKELSLKYTEILGHQNHKQKIRHVADLKMKNLELSKKYMDLEGKNFKLNKLVDKLMREIDDLKPGKKYKMIEDKENLGSPKSLKGTHSPGPLKDKN
ncbi:hyaluronan-mediated motility receptor-like [Tribolium madens]|uniref:hyaluronan-mediated motility receptor-like n=1 Tax=Tribolium madens TaxID=41895 RepID=UPI001CF75E62|nr:hyaluronan-mediated motility receptor-like [Tribolium madens]